MHVSKGFDPYPTSATYIPFVIINIGVSLPLHLLTSNRPRAFCTVPKQSFKKEGLDLTTVEESGFRLQEPGWNYRVGINVCARGEIKDCFYTLNNLL